VNHRSYPAASITAVASIVFLLSHAASIHAATDAEAGPPSAQSLAGETEGGIPEIVVTARKREESIQSVPISVDAISSATLTESNSVTVFDLPNMVSNLQIYSGYQPDTPAFEMRGQFQEDTSPALDPSVGVYFDDVYIARSPGTLLQFQDMDRVEVLKGPQGTLYGRNSTGGAIKLVSKKPTDQFEAEVSSAYEFEAHRWIEKGMLNVPLGDTLAVRMVGTYTKTDLGYFTYYTAGEPNANIPLDSGHDAGGRVELAWHPSDKFDALLEADYTDWLGGDVASRLVYYNGNDAATPSLGNLSITAIEAGLETSPSAYAAFLHGNPVPAATAGTAYLNNIVAQSAANPYRVGQDASALPPGTIAVGGQITGGNPLEYAHHEIMGSALTLHWDFGDFSLKSISSVRGLKVYDTEDIDGTVLHLIDGYERERQNQESQEFTLNGGLGGHGNWTAGAFYFREVNDFEDFTRVFVDISSLPTAPGLPGGAGSATIGDLLSQSAAVYGQANYDLMTNLTATLGLRYTEDWRGSNPESQAFFTDGTQACAIEIGGVANCDTTRVARFHNLSYTAGLSYHLTEDKMLYFTSADAYRAGGFNPRINTESSFVTFKPETATNYELGFKADWLDHRLRTNYAAFFTDYKDIQTTQSQEGTLFGEPAQVVLLINSASAHIYGFESEMTGRPVDPLLLGVNLGYLYSTFHSNVLAEQGLTSLPNAPKFTGSTFVKLTLPINSNLNGAVRLDESYRSATVDELSLTDHNSSSPTYGQVVYRPEYRAYALMNASLIVTDQRHGLEYSFYGKNLMNKFYETRFVGSDGTGLFYGVAGPPREFGVSVQASFGKH
jgi:iron complex outermembrane receptor protein